MARVTIEQVKNWNSKLSNGFAFDIERYVVWSEKQAVKYIKLEDGTTLGVTLMYRAIKAPNGYSYTGKHQPCLHLQIWHKSHTEGMMHSWGMGVTIDVGDEQDKKKWNELCKLSTVLDEQKIMELCKLNHHKELADKVGRII